MNKKRIYDDAKDKNVAAVVVYLNDSNELFYDEEFKVAVPEADMFDLFCKGVLAAKADVYYTAKSFTAGAIDFGVA